MLRAVARVSTPLLLSSSPLLCTPSTLASLSLVLNHSTLSSFPSLVLKHITLLRGYATQKELAQVPNNSSTAVAKTLAKAAVRTTYTAAGFLSIGIAAVLLYFLADLVVSPTSENSVFKKCVGTLIDNEQVIKTLGEPIHTYGYSVRSHPFHYTKYTNSKGTVIVKVQFDIEGPKSKGVVHAELEQTGFLTTKVVSLVVNLPGWKKNITVVDL